MVIKLYRYFSTVTKKAFKTISNTEVPLIKCKRSEFNLYNHNLPAENAKFGSIPLASNGWKHYKSKGDYFIINPQKDECPKLMNEIENLTQLNINNDIIRNLKNELEITHLTEIQDIAIPQLLDMHHILLAAETGCGKTLSYLIPIITKLIEYKSRLKNQNFNTPFALILTPGRELATQISTVAEKLTLNTNISIKTILGGKTKQMIINPEFNEVDILIGTIGAISKLVTTGIYKMNQVRHLVLDEADTLLDDSFTEKLCHFLKKFPFHRNHLNDLSDKIVGTQLILASATMPVNITEILTEVIDTGTIHEVVSKNLHKLMPHIKQIFLRMNKSDRPAKLLEMIKLKLRKKQPIIVFSNKSVTSDFISLFLNDHGVNCINLNGDMLMQVRIGKFEKFQNGEVDILSTTDVGSRGLDTTRARHIINFDFPLHISDYIHRCGRIGRIGSHENCSVTNFISSLSELLTVQKIEHTARIKSILPQVNANITNLIQKKIINEIQKLEAI